MTAIPQRSEQRLHLAGDRFYSFIRAIVLLLLLALALRLNNHSILPPTSSPFAILWWIYALFACFMAAAQFVPSFDRLMPWAFLGDLALLSGITQFSGTTPRLFYALFLLPTTWAAIRRQPRASIITGLLAAVFYIGSTVLYQGREKIPIDLQALVELSLNSVTLVCLSWLTSTLAARWSQINRQMVDEARRETTAAVAEAESYRDRTRALYEVAFKLGTTMNYQAVLDTAVQESMRLVKGTTSLVLLSSGEPDELYVAAGLGLNEGDLNRRVKVDPQGILGQTFGSGTARIIQSPTQYPDMSAIAALRRCANACCVPLSAGRRNYGLLLVGTVSETPFNEEELGMLAAMANYAIIAMLNTQLVQELREERTKLISKEEEVRQQLSRDLHDGPAQSVAAITMNIEFVKRLLERDPERVQDELTKMGDLARRTTYDIRTLLFELRPLTLDSQGLVTTLREYATRFKDGPTQVIFEEHVGEVHLDAKREGTLFNIIQESTNNALKHAQAKHIWIRLQRQGEELMATIQDDGKGFDLQGVRKTYHQRGSFGLLNIEERARMVGGSAEMTSAPGAGTTVRVIVPFDADSL